MALLQMKRPVTQLVILRKVSVWSVYMSSCSLAHTSLSDTPCLRRPQPPLPTKTETRHRATLCYTHRVVEIRWIRLCCSESNRPERHFSESVLQNLSRLNLQRCFLSPSVWTSPHIQIAHSSTTAQPIPHQLFTDTHLLYCCSALPQALYGSEML